MTATITIQAHRPIMTMDRTTPREIVRATLEAARRGETWARLTPAQIMRIEAELATRGAQHDDITDEPPRAA